jgi:hypothetical protein
VKGMFVNIGCLSYRRLVLLCFIITLLCCKQPTEVPNETRAITEHASFYLYFRDDQDMIHQTKIQISNGIFSLEQDSILPIYVFRDSVSIDNKSFLKWEKIMLGNKDSLDSFQNEFNKEATKAKKHLAILKLLEYGYRR